MSDEAKLNDRAEDARCHFFKGALILSVAGVVVKLIGSVNWILLSWVLGGEGIGIYQIAFPLYLLALCPEIQDQIATEAASLGDSPDFMQWRANHRSKGRLLLMLFLC